MAGFLQKLKSADIKDLGHFFLFLMAVPPALCMRRKRKNLWLVCEYGLEARDNGYWFFKYVRENHREQDIVYAIDFRSGDYGKVKDLGECVRYGSFSHWVYYLCAQINLSSHKGGKPNAAVCYFLEVYGLLKNKRVFLQHGITMDYAETFYYKNTKMRLFICGARPEYEFIKKEFGYPEGYVAYTGFARFDQLGKDAAAKKKLILVAPTWRRWLYQISSDPYENAAGSIEATEYYKKWSAFLESAELHAILKEHHYELVFFPHRNMTGSFHIKLPPDGNVSCVTWEQGDIQLLMKEASCMITDYSSTAMDFAYMKKPVIYYQFDEERYRREHLKQGYYDYKKQGFGSVCASLEELLPELKQVISSNCTMREEYRKRVDQFFVLRDERNSERIYREVKKLQGEEA